MWTALLCILATLFGMGLTVSGLIALAALLVWSFLRGRPARCFADLVQGE
jgi:uncharacterized membrane protein